ncbi:MAG TPA: hypothetical protein VN748_19695 [Pseudonocardiaceae bacterium]|nr:hypothetical protein [Pseudonocardiaceae bacterium]
MCERHDRGDVTNRPQPVGGSTVLIDPYLALVAKRYADRVQAQVGSAKSAARADDHDIAAQHGAVFKGDDCVSAVTANDRASVSTVGPRCVGLSPARRAAVPADRLAPLRRLGTAADLAG